MEVFENDYQPLIKELGVLRHVAPSEQLRKRIGQLSRSNRQPLSFFTPVRVALTALMLLFLTGGGIYAATTAELGKPLYQVREALDQAVQTVLPSQNEYEEQVQQPQEHEPTPTPSDDKEVQKRYAPSPTPIPSYSPTTTPPSQGKADAPGQTIVATEESNKGLQIKEALGVGASVSVSPEKSKSPNDTDAPERKMPFELPVQAQAEVTIKEKPIVKIDL